MAAPGGPTAGASSAVSAAEALAVPLLKWVKTFQSELSSECKSIESLSNGVLLFELLSILAPAQFDMEDITREPGSNSVLATNNVSKLLHQLEAFFEDVFEKKVDLSYINATAVARDKSVSEIVKMLELVILCAINSVRKDDAVGNIMTSLDDAEQQQLMFVINDVMERVSNSGGNNASSSAASPSAGGATGNSSSQSGAGSHSHSHSQSSGHKRTGSASSLADELASPLKTAVASASSASAEALAHSIRDLQAERSELQDRLDASMREVRELRRREDFLRSQLEQSNQERDQMLKEAVTEIQKEVHRESEDKRKAEATKLHKLIDEAESRAAEFKAQVTRLKDQLEILTRKRAEEQAEWKDEQRKLLDDLALSKDASKRLVQMEATLARYKKKLGDVGDVASQLKFSEDQYNQSLEKIIQLESDNKQIPMLKDQVASLKSKLVNLETALTEAKVTEERFKNEVALQAEELASVKQEMQSISDQLDQSRSELATLKRDQAMNSPGKNSLRDMMAGDLKEQVLRLQLENKQLREGGNDARLASLTDELDMARAKAKTHEDKYLEAQMKLMQFESQLKRKDAQLAQMSNTAAKPNVELEVLKEENLRLQQQIAAAHIKAAGQDTLPAEFAQATSKMEALMIRNKKLEQFAKTAQRKLKLQSDELTQVKQQNASDIEKIRVLKKQVTDLQAELKERERVRTESKAATTREQRLLSAAFYELGMEYHSALMAGRALPPSERPAKASWMNKQRAGHT